jgi:maltose alpha-D-glucosyltransferase/alpha-amylase
LGGRAAERTTRKASCFPGQQTTTWTFDRTAGQYYFHRFYDHQPDLNTWNPYVRAEIHKIMGFWLQLGVSGFRMDAVPFLIEKKGPGVEHQQDFNILKEMRDFLQWRSGDAILLAEANVPPDESMNYFGDDGQRLQLMLNFAVNQRLFYALATGDTEPLVWGLEQTHKRPANAQWVQFLRSHDEQDLGRLEPEQREQVFKALCAAEADAVVRPRHPTAADADARQQPPAAGARLQPVVLAARDADDAVRRRNRHGRQPAAPRT